MSTSSPRSAAAAVAERAGWFADRSLDAAFGILDGGAGIASGGSPSTVMVDKGPVHDVRARLADLHRANAAGLRMDTRAGAPEVDGYVAAVRQEPAEQLSERAARHASHTVTSKAGAQPAAMLRRPGPAGLFTAIAGLLLVALLSVTTLRSVKRPGGRGAASSEGLPTPSSPISVTAGESSAEIGNVTQVITSIVERIDSPALDAVHLATTVLDPMPDAGHRGRRSAGDEPHRGGWLVQGVRPGRARGRGS